MKVLIVDDEPLARRRLWRLLERLPDIDIVGEAKDGHEALSMIEALSPDLVLLDVDMPGLDGVALSRRLTGAVAIVFTTAHREHAVEAFALDAVDYLLKPIDDARLAAAIDRVRERRAPAKNARRTHALPFRLQARAHGVVELLDPFAVSRLYASDKYTLCKVAGREYVLDESLHQLEAKLVPIGFMRVHRREIVQLSKVRALHVEPDGAELELSDGERAKVSRRSLAEVKSKLGLS